MLFCGIKSLLIPGAAYASWSVDHKIYQYFIKPIVKIKKTSNWG